MKKFKNRLKKIVVCVMSAAMMLLCSVVSVLADEETSDPNLNGGFTTDGQIVPYLPEEVYGKNYILINTGNDSTSGSGRILCLYLLPDDAVVTAKNLSGSSNIYNGSGSQVIIFSLPAGTYASKYYYRTSSGWSEPELVTSLNSTITPPYLFISRSTVNILNTDDNSVIYFSKNTDIIYRPDYKLVLSGFGSMLSGFMSSLSGCAIGMFCFACILCVGFIGLITRVINRRF